MVGGKPSALSAKTRVIRGTDRFRMSPRSLARSSASLSAISRWWATTRSRFSQSREPETPSPARGKEAHPAYFQTSPYQCPPEGLARGRIPAAPSNMQRLSEGPERRLLKGLAQGGMRMDRLRDILEPGAHFES